jgi:threonine/homoserine/homoserine lactone efflux protein
MNDVAHVLSLLAVAHLFSVMTPGANSALVISSAMHSRAKGLVVAASFWPAGAFWAAMGLAGMGEVMRKAPAIEFALRIACGCYLLFLGQKLIRNAWKGRGLPMAQAPELSTPKLFLAGFLTNLLNARVIAYYASIFTAAGAYSLPWQWQLVAIFGMPAIGFSWNCFMTLVVSSPPVRRALEGATHWIDGASGAILLAFGFSLLVRP